MAENDAGLDIENWTGHTGCDCCFPSGWDTSYLNLPTWGKCNNEKFEMECSMKIRKIFITGGAFKLTFRDVSGLVVGYADNYFGYCKKE